MMSTIDLIEEWIEIRAKLQRQIKALQSGDAILGLAHEPTLARLQRFIGELNDLLKERARVDQG